MVRENLVELQQLPIPGSRGFLIQALVRFFHCDLAQVSHLCFLFGVQMIEIASFLMAKESISFSLL